MSETVEAALATASQMTTERNEWRERARAAEANYASEITRWDGERRRAEAAEAEVERLRAALMRVVGFLGAQDELGLSEPSDLLMLTYCQAALSASTEEHGA